MSVASATSAPIEYSIDIAISSTIKELFDSGKFQEAIAFGEDRILDFAGTTHDDVFLRFGLAQCYLAQAKISDNPHVVDGAKKKAIAHLQCGIKHKPDDTYCLQLLGELYVNQHKLAEAEALFQQVYKTGHSKNVAVSLSWLFEIDAIQGKWPEAEEKAEALYTHAKQTRDDKGTAIALTLWSQALGGQGKWPEAEEKAKEKYTHAKQTRDDKGTAIALTLWSQALGGQGKWPEAEQKAEALYTHAKQTHNDKDTAIALGLWSQALGGQGKWAEAEEKAKEKYTHAKQTCDDKDTAIALGLLGISQLKQQKLDAAEKTASALTELDAKSLYALVLHTRIDIARGNFEDAYSKALKLNNVHGFDPTHLHLLRYSAHKAGKSKDYASYVGLAKQCGALDKRDSSFDPITTLSPEQERQLLEDIDTGNRGRFARSQIFNTELVPIPINADVARAMFGNGEARDSYRREPANDRV